VRYQWAADGQEEEDYDGWVMCNDMKVRNMKNWKELAFSDLVEKASTHKGLQS
jgi:hypothetical protein